MTDMAKPVMKAKDAIMPKKDAFIPMDWKQYELLNRVELTRPTGKADTYGFFVDETDGVLVMRELRPGSPAEAAGLAIGDILFAVNGRRVATRAELKTETQKGTTIRLTVFRKRSEPLDPATLRPPSEGLEDDRKRDNNYFICRLDLCPLSILGVDIASNKGHLHVTSISSTGAGTAAGLKANDRILAVNNETVTDKECFKNMITAARGDIVDLLVERPPSDERASVKCPMVISKERQATQNKSTIPVASALNSAKAALASLGSLSPASSVKGMTISTTSSGSFAPGLASTAGQNEQSIRESIEDIRRSVPIVDHVQTVTDAYREQFADTVKLNGPHYSKGMAVKGKVVAITNVKMGKKTVAKPVKKGKPR